MVLLSQHIDRNHNEDQDSVTDKNKLHNLSDAENCHYICDNESEIMVLSVWDAVAVTHQPVSLNNQSNNQIPCSAASHTGKLLKLYLFK